MNALTTICVGAPLLLLLLGAMTWHETESQPDKSHEETTQPDHWTPASVRTAIESRYREWGDARIAYDREELEALVTPDLYIQMADRRITGEEFLSMVSQKNPNGSLTRFDVEILSVTKSGEDWQLVICEKLEWTATGAEDQGPAVYSLWVTRDGWRYTEEGEWLITYSEEIGHENWRGVKPPFEDW